MTELSDLIDRLKKGIVKNASYIRTIKHPQLLLLALQELNDLIGNDKVKDSVATQISHLIMMKRRALDNPQFREDDVMLNTVLYGPPGVGKTLVGTKLAKIWYSLGYLDGSKNTKERKGELGQIINDMFNNNNGGTSDETLALLYVMFMFIIVLVTVLSLAWSFYSKFGGWWTIAAVSFIFILLIIIALFISSSINSSNNNVNNANNVNNKSDKNKGKKSDGKKVDTEDLSCKGNTCASNDNVEAPKNGINNINQSNEYGNSPLQIEIPSDDQMIKVVTRADLVDKYVGWSDKKTIKLLEENLGKVVFVDEAYSIVTDMHDSFGLEVLTTINLFLSQHPKEIILIFAGYKDLMETGIFSFQPGLRRRFMWQFDCNGYNTSQLFQIFKMQLNKKGWGLRDESATAHLFGVYKHCFPAYGGDTERLTFFAELEHSRDFINNESNMAVNLIETEHVRKGILKLQENNIQSNPDEDSVNPLANMMKMFRKPKKRVEEVDDEFDLINAVRNSAKDRTHH